MCNLTLFFSSLFNQSVDSNNKFAPLLVCFYFVSKISLTDMYGKSNNFQEQNTQIYIILMKVQIALIINIWSNYYCLWKFRSV